jgi:hypothetical protein
LEAQIHTKLDAYDIEEECVLLLLERVNEAQRIATREIRDSMCDKDTRKSGKKRKHAVVDHDNDNDD